MQHDWANEAPRRELHTYYAATDWVETSARVAGAGALVAGIAWAVSFVFDWLRLEGQGFMHATSEWWSKPNAYSLVVCFLILVTGWYTFTQGSVPAASFLIGPSAVLAVKMGTMVGALHPVPVHLLVMGYWAALVMTGASIVCAIAAFVFVLGEVRNEPLRLEPVPVLVAAAATVLGLAACLTDRVAIGGYGAVVKDGSIFSDHTILNVVHGGWHWAFAIGVFILVAGLPALAIFLGRDAASSRVALGAAVAMLVWDSEMLSSAALRAHHFNPRIGFWLSLAAAGLLVWLSVLLRAGARHHAGPPVRSLTA